MLYISDLICEVNKMGCGGGFGGFGGGCGRRYGCLLPGCLLPILLAIIVITGLVVLL